MGEYVNHLSRGRVKIGTCENLYYVSFQKFASAFEFLKQAPNNATPEEYLKDGSGFRFRFPFPDEDTKGFGEINGPFNRSEVIGSSNGNVIQLCYQRFVDGQLMTVVLIGPPEANDFDCKMFRLPFLHAWIIAEKIKRENVIPDADKIAERILSGYELKKAKV